MSPFKTPLRQRVRGSGRFRNNTRRHAARAAIVTGILMLLIAATGYGFNGTPEHVPAVLEQHRVPLEHIGPKPGSSATTEFVGEVIAVGEGVLVVMIGETKQAFVITEKTQVTLNHRPARIQDVMPGHTATIFSEKQGDQLIAKAVDARASY